MESVWVCWRWLLLLGLDVPEERCKALLYWLLLIRRRHWFVNWVWVLLPSRFQWFGLCSTFCGVSSWILLWKYVDVSLIPSCLTSFLFAYAAGRAHGWHRSQRWSSWLNCGNFCLWILLVWQFTHQSLKKLFLRLRLYFFFFNLSTSWFLLWFFLSLQNILLLTKDAWTLGMPHSRLEWSNLGWLHFHAHICWFLFKFKSFYHNWLKLLLFFLWFNYWIFELHSLLWKIIEAWVAKSCSWSFSL